MFIIILPTTNMVTTPTCAYNFRLLADGQVTLKRVKILFNFTLLFLLFLVFKLFYIYIFVQGYLLVPLSLGVLLS